MNKGVTNKTNRVKTKSIDKNVPANALINSLVSFSLLAFSKSL